MFPINQPEVLISHAMDRFDQEGNLTDVPTRQHITGLLQNLVDWARTSGRNDQAERFQFARNDDPCHLRA